jgi:hypothetical protein
MSRNPGLHDKKVDTPRAPKETGIKYGLLPMILDGSR